jgi:hypothetical protein
MPDFNELLAVALFQAGAGSVDDISPAFGFSLYCDHHLSKVLVSFKIAMRLSDLVEGE